MKSQFNKLIRYCAFLLCFCSTYVLANTAHINYSNATSNHYTNLKGHLEDMGYTVTSTNSGTVTLSDFTGKDLHINIAGNNNCGNNCKTAYESYIGAGGTVIIAGNADATNRNGSIESLVESKLSVGTITIYGTSSTSAYSSYASGNAYSLAGNTNQWGVDLVFNMNSGGTAIALNNATWETWAKYDYGSNGGKLIITMDQDQFNLTGTTETRVMTFLEETLEDVGALTSTVSITSSQTTAVNTAKGTSDNGVDLNVNGDDNTVNIEQVGEDNFITGSDWSSTGTITGNNNTLNVDQGNVTTSGNSGRNGIGLDVTGNTNTLNLSQGDYATDVGDHRMHIDIDGSTNTLNLTQRNDGDTASEHYMSLDLDSSSNVIALQQLNDGDKFLFLDIDNNNNTVDVNQSGDGSHYMDIKLGTGSYAHDVDISQTGDGNHAGRVDLDGYATDFDLLQQGSTSQSYSLDMTCGTANGCAVSTTQGN